MAAIEQRPMVGVFYDPVKADRAIDELRQAGFHREQIETNVTLSPSRRSRLPDPVMEKDAVAAGLAGSVAGAAVGIFGGMSISAGVGPTFVQPSPDGSWVGLMVNPLMGLVMGSILGALLGLVLPTDRMQRRDDGFQSITTLTVHAEGRSEEAVCILRRNGAYNVYAPSCSPGQLVP